MQAVAELAVSNICWPDGLASQEEAIATLASMGVFAIDIAPGKAFPEIATVGADAIDRDELTAYRRTLRSSAAGIMRVAGLQAVTFGRTESIFSEDAEQVDALTNHMQGIIRLAGFVGARSIVYGSGGTRLVEGLTPDQVEERALGFFGSLNAEAADAGVVLGIEPVSTTWTQGKPVFGRTARELVDFTAICATGYGFKNLQFVPDSFAIHDGLDHENNETIADLIAEAARKSVLAPHAQIAEPGMRPHGFESPIADSHTKLDEALSANWQSQQTPTIAIEMFPESLIESSLRSVIIAARQSYERCLNS